MHIGLFRNCFNKKFIQSQLKYSAASAQIRNEQKLEGDTIELSDEENSIIRATYYLQGLLIKTETIPSKRDSSSAPSSAPRQPIKQMHAIPLSPSELQEKKEARDERRQKEQVQNIENFESSIAEETTKQKIIIQKYSFSHLNDKEIREDLTPEQLKDIKEQFYTFMSEINKTILVYRGISSPKEWPVFELFCSHCIDQVEAMASFDNHKDCDYSGVRQFLYEIYVIADEANLDYVEEKVFAMMVQYKIPVGSRFYYRRLTNLKQKGDFIGISSLWDQMSDQNKTSLGLKCAELALSGIVIDNFTKACSILGYVAHTPLVDIRGYPDNVYKIMYQFIQFERVSLDSTDQNITNFELLIQSCASIIRKFQAPHQISYLTAEQTSKIIQMCAVSSVNAWDYLSKWDTYVNRNGRIEVYDDMIEISQCFADGPAMARKLFNEIIMNRIVPRMETLNALLLVHIKYGEIQMAKTILKTIDFSPKGYIPNATTKFIMQHLEGGPDTKISPQKE